MAMAHGHGPWQTGGTPHIPLDQLQRTQSKITYLLYLILIAARRTAASPRAPPPAYISKTQKLL